MRHVPLRDRFPQMEMFRRQVVGRLAELLGLLSPAASDGGTTAKPKVPAPPTPAPSLSLDALTRSQGFFDAASRHLSQLSTIRLTAPVPTISGASPADILLVSDPMFPDGFPRPGDHFGIDAASSIEPRGPRP
jgi:hypothetical protein